MDKQLASILEGNGRDMGDQHPLDFLSDISQHASALISYFYLEHKLRLKSTKFSSRGLGVVISCEILVAPKSLSSYLYRSMSMTMESGPYMPGGRILFVSTIHYVHLKPSTLPVDLPLTDLNNKKGLVAYDTNKSSFYWVKS